MSTFVLVHGAWDGSWIWEDVTPLLKKAGHEVVALDLPGHIWDPSQGFDACRKERDADSR